MIADILGSAATATLAGLMFLAACALAAAFVAWFADLGG